jgi:hypothetical protein
MNKAALKISNENLKRIGNYGRNKSKKNSKKTPSSIFHLPFTYANGNFSNARVYGPGSKGFFTRKNEINARKSNENRRYIEPGPYSLKRRQNVALLATHYPNKVYIPSKPISNATINTNLEHAEERLFNYHMSLAREIKG